MAKKPSALVVATGNPGKLRELREILHDLPVNVIGLRDLPGVDEPVEDGESFAEIARDKAAYYARATGHWCLADDSGLEVDALEGRPGVHSARFAADRVPAQAGRDVIDQANNAKLLELLADVPVERRTARFVCALALAREDGEIVLETRGTVEGVIGRQPRGNNGFGYDPLFLVPDQERTTAELTAAEKSAISHRGQATRAFAKAFAEILRSQ